MSAGFNEPDRSTFLPALVGNLLPLAGIVFLNWRPEKVLFVYWIEIGVFIVLYSLSILFAKQEPKEEGRAASKPTLPVPFLCSRFTRIRPFDWMPPIYCRNVQYTAGLLLWGLFFWWIVGSLIVIMPSSETLESVDGGGGPLVRDVLSIVADAFSPAILVAGIVLIISHIITIRRDVFGQKKHERFSAPMMAEIPVRYVLFWFVLILFTYLVFPLVAWPLVLVFDLQTISDTGVSLLVIGGKLTIEWAALRARRVDEPDGIAGWFTPGHSPPRD